MYMISVEYFFTLRLIISGPAHVNPSVPTHVSFRYGFQRVCARGAAQFLQ